MEENTLRIDTLQAIELAEGVEGRRRRRHPLQHPRRFEAAEGPGARKAAKDAEEKVSSRTVIHWILIDTIGHDSKDDLPQNWRPWVAEGLHLWLSEAQ
jgi:hypothetical protein